MKFEYRVVVVGPDDIRYLSEEEEWLNKAGALEWELVSIVRSVPSDPAEYKDYYFKRHIEINEKLRKSQLKEVPNNDDKPSTTTGGISEEGL